MKYLIFVLVSFILVGCGSKNQDFEAAKQKLLSEGIESSLSGELENSSSSDTSLESQTGEIDETQASVFFEQNNESLLIFNPLEEDSLTHDTIDISGIIKGSVDKITVEFENLDSDFPKDSYELKSFTPGATSFLYRASVKNQVLDYGTNVYIFHAWQDGRETTQEVRIFLPENDFVVQEVVGGNISDLPQASNYGTPESRGNDEFGYSDIPGFTLKKHGYDTFGCQDLEKFLKQTQKSWYYWNTCRDVSSGEGISYYIIRLEGEKYIYEKQYYDFKNSWYGVLELEQGEGITQESIAQKNDELKTKTFVLPGLVDILMRDISNS